jgi:tRNA(adenine34) deaminase
MHTRADDERWMREALAHASASAQAGDVPVGAVVVRNGERIAAAGNAMHVAADATQHAEMRVIQAAMQVSADARLGGCTLYVTLEPCAMCAGAIVLARLDRVVFGAWDDKAGMVGSILDIVRHPRLNHRPEVVGGVLAEESAALLRRFFADRRGASPLTG